MIAVDQNMPIKEVMDLLAKERIGAVLVTGEGGNLAGILSERDIVRGLSEQIENIGNLRALQLMTKKVITCSSEDKIDYLMRLMTDHRIRHLPVVDR